MTNRFITYAAADLKHLDRKRLQLLCKVFGVSCKSKTSILVDALTAVAAEDGGSLRLVPFFTNEKEDTLKTVREQEPIQIALSKFRAQSVGRLYEVQKESKKRSSKVLKEEEDGVKEYYPSVTTVLDKTKTFSQRIALMKWRESKIRELGKEGFAAMSKEILSSGTGFHKMLSDHLKELSNESSSPLERNLTSSLKKETSLYNLAKSVSPVMNQISSIFAIESSIQHPLLRYAGTLDCILELDGKVCLIDWKTSSRYRRTLASLYDYPIQAVAYAGAANFDSQYHFQTKHVGLAIAYEDGSPADLHMLSPEQCEEYWLMWLSRLSAFYKDFPWETFQNAREREESVQEEEATERSCPENKTTPKAKHRTVGQGQFKMTNFLTLSKPMLQRYLVHRSK